MRKRTIQILLILLSIMFTIPSIIYLIQNKTVYEYDTYFKFLLNLINSKKIQTLIFIILYVLISLIYLALVKKSKQFKNIKEILILVGIVSIIFAIVLPFTSSDIFYYMGTGELDSRYNQNPYYVSMEEYYTQNQENIQDEILQKGAVSYWRKTTVVYGPIWTLICKMLTFISFKNITLCLYIFKLANVIAHCINCYLIYKITNKKSFACIYGLNPFILLEGITNVHNDIIVITFILLGLYFLLKKKNLLVATIFLSLATGIKYFAIMLLPIFILTYYKNEENLGKRFKYCLKYGIIFVAILAIAYLIYFRDFNILKAMLVQDTKYTKSLHLITLTYFGTDISVTLKNIMMIIFILGYVKFAIDLLTQKEINLRKTMQKYNLLLLFFMLVLTSFQPWYIIWLFATFMWQKPKMIKKIINLSLVSQLGNCAFMLNVESYVYDIYFIGIIVFCYLILDIITEKKERKEIEKISFDRWK